MPKKGQTVKSKKIKFSTFLGMDPGVSGGLAVILATGEVFLRKTPDANIDLVEWMLQWRHAETVGCIEALVSYRAGTDPPSSRMIQYGRSYGRLEVAAAAAGIGLEDVPPQRWQRHFGVTRAKDEERADFKRRLREVAKGLYPKLTTVTLDNCDALLLARYCKDTYGVDYKG